MVIVAPSVWRLEFARKAAIARDLEQRLRDERRSKDKREKEERETRAAEQSGLLSMVEFVLASEQHIEAFAVKLDALDAATVEALMQNEQALIAVRERIAAMLIDAHVLPDGRRVFKTRDGTEVFDEFGTAVSAEEITPEEIHDDKPVWEDFAAELERDAALQREREELLAFQEQLDTARERLDDPALTEDELSALEDELGAVAPERVTAILNRDTGGPEPGQGERASRVPDQDRLVPQNLAVPAGP